jgi:hypothetical protein
LDEKSIKCQWIGFNSYSLGQCIYWPEHDLCFPSDPGETIQSEGETVITAPDSITKEANAKTPNEVNVNQESNNEANNEARDPLHNFEPNPEAPTLSGYGHCTTKPSNYIC